MKTILESVQKNVCYKLLALFLVSVLGLTACGAGNRTSQSAVAENSSSHEVQSVAAEADDQEVTGETQAVDTDQSAAESAQISASRYEVLFERRTLHSNYDSTPLDQEMIDIILRAGFSAPTGGNQRSIEFFPVTDRDKLYSISQLPGYFSGVDSAPLAIIVAGNDDQAFYEDLQEMDSGMAAQAMIVAATDLGLSTCVMSIAPLTDRMSGISEILSLTDNYSPILLVTFGYPAADAVSSASVNAYNEGQVHYNGLE